MLWLWGESPADQMSCDFGVSLESLSLCLEKPDTKVKRLLWSFSIYH